MEAGLAPRFHDLLDALLHHAERDPDRIAFTFVEEERQRDAAISFGGLLERTIRIGSSLQSMSEAGERTLVMLPPSLDFVPTFLGALWAGLVPCVAYPPTTPAAASAIGTSFREVQASFLITSDAVAAGLAATPEWTDLGLPTPVALEALESPGDGRKRRETKLAFLQYTSGSTSAPKAIRVTREGLAKHCEQTRAAFGYDRQTVSVSWLPVSHCFGLFTALLCPLYVGHQSVQLPAQRFVDDPIRWLKSIDRFRATVSSAPNAAYERLCRALELAPPDAALDLSCWGFAGMGGDVMHPKTLHWIREALRPFGMPLSALKPAYGLSETTMYVSGGSPGSVARTVYVDGQALQRERVAIVEPEAPNARGAIGVGSVVAGCDLVLVNVPARRVAEPDRLGEIWVRGPGVADGYWGRPEESRAIFGAKLGNVGPEYLRTGDLGFFHDGELFVTGRSKEVIVAGGLTLFPSDIEASVRDCAPDLTTAALAAFPWRESGSTGLAVAIELDAPPREMTERIFGRIARDHHVDCEILLFASPGSLPRTTRGRVQRVQLAELAEEARLPCTAVRRR